MTKPLDLIYLEKLVKERLPIIKQSCMLYSPQNDTFRFLRNNALDRFQDKNLTRIARTYYNESYSFMAKDLAKSAKEWISKYLKEGIVDCVYTGYQLKTYPSMLPHTPTDEQRFFGYMLLWNTNPESTIDHRTLYLDFFFYPRHEFSDEFRGVCRKCPNFLMCGIKKKYPEGPCEIVTEVMK